MRLWLLPAERARKMVIVGVIAGVLALQLWHTLRDKNRWPFSSNNMFNRALPERFEQLRVRLLDAQGWTPLREVGGLMPLEFFRVVEYLATIYLNPEVTPDQRSEIARTVLYQMNEATWSRFDEIAAPAKPREGQWIGLELFLVTVDLNDYDATTGEPLHEVTSLHREVLGE